MITHNLRMKIHQQIELVVGYLTNLIQNLIFSYVFIDNTYSTEELEAWYNRVVKNIGTADFEFCCELKYDGASVNLLYEEGKLVRG